MMAQSLELHNEEHEHEEDVPTVTIALAAGILSLVFGLAAVLTNSVLLFTFYKDPYRYFQARATTYFVASLSLSDFIGGCVVQPLYAAYMLGIVGGTERRDLNEVSSVLSHANTKVSILTVVALSIDRFLAVKLSWKYKALVTVRKVMICNVLIWLFCGIFEATHSLDHASEKSFHTIDLHLQTTAPLIVLCAVYTAMYIEFRRYSRNVVFVRTVQAGRSRTYVRNMRLEKKIASTVVLIIIVLFVSLMPYLVVKELEEPCHEDPSDGCSEFGVVFAVAKALSVPMLCVSCVANPFLYAWRIPQYKQALRSVGRSIRNKWRRQMFRSATPVSNMQTALASGSLIEKNTPEVDLKHPGRANIGSDSGGPA